MPFYNIYIYKYIKAQRNESPRADRNQGRQRYEQNDRIIIREIHYCSFPFTNFLLFFFKSIGCPETIFDIIESTLEPTMLLLEANFRDFVGEFSLLDFLKDQKMPNFFFQSFQKYFSKMTFFHFKAKAIR